MNPTRPPLTVIRHDNRTPTDSDADEPELYEDCNDTEFAQLVAAARMSSALGDLVRKRAEQLVRESTGRPRQLVFPPRLVEALHLNGETLDVLFVGTRAFEHEGRRFVVNAEMNGVRVKDAMRFLVRDGSGRPCRAQKALGSAELLHRVHAFPAVELTLVRFFVHLAGEPRLLKEKFFEVREGEDVQIDADEYQDHLRGLQLSR